MPCFVREKSLSVRHRNKRNNERDISAPKPVRPRAIRYHGLFSLDIAKLHLVVDNTWTPDSLTGQLAGLSDLLKRQAVYKRHDIRNNRRRLIETSKLLKRQCSDGRIKLQKMQHSNNALKVRTFLMKHKDMQRLYHKMPIHLVVDNINQRTFVLRKERDRLECMLAGRKHEYKELLVYCAKIENHIKYENEFVLQDELTSRTLLKKIENSEVRQKAIRTINNAYKKMIQVLRQDEIFYEPILRSLQDDMEDQTNMIKHILYLGMPVISKFRELNHDYNNLEEKARQSNITKMNVLQLLLQNQTRNSHLIRKHKDEIPKSANPKRYLRKTYSMTVLNIQLRSVERTIKNLKAETLCSQAKEIYPSAKALNQSNNQFLRRTQFKTLNSKVQNSKMQYINTFKDLLINNLGEEELNRLARIEELEKALKYAEEQEEETLEYLKNRGDAIILFRTAFWNLLEILRHIEGQQKSFRHSYPNSYLKLPLLKFEMLHMYSAPPEIQQEDVTKLIQIVKKILYKLMKGYHKTKRREPTLQECKNQYHAAYLNTVHHTAYAVDDKQDSLPKEDLLVARKYDATIPSRKQIKVQSAKILDEVSKRLEFG